MGVEWVAGLQVVLAVACLGGAAWLFFRETWFLQWLRGTVGFVLVGIAVYASLVAASLFSYQTVAGDTPLAVLSFEAKSPQKWQVTVSEANGNRRAFDFQGDLWQLDVRLLRYVGVASVFGTSPSFELDRLSGRYVALEDQATKDRADFQLHTAPFMGFDLWQRAADHGSLIVEATRSNVSLVPAADGAIFEVTFGENGLALRPANSAAEEALRSVGG